MQKFMKQLFVPNATVWTLVNLPSEPNLGMAQDFMFQIKVRADSSTPVTFHPVTFGSVHSGQVQCTSLPFSQWIQEQDAKDFSFVFIPEITYKTDLFLI